MGIRLTGDTPLQVWARELSPSAHGRPRAAVALYHRGGAPPPVPPMPPAGHCHQWTHTRGGYYEACDADSARLPPRTHGAPPRAASASPAAPPCLGHCGRHAPI